MSWNYDRIRETVIKEQNYDNATKEELLERIFELECALYPYVATLSSLLEKAWRGTYVTSKLFPMRPEVNEEKFLVFNSETHKSDEISLTEDQYATTDYYQTESLDITDGSKLGDEFEILGVHQTEMACYVFCGNITINDVKHSINIFHKGANKNEV